MTLVIPFVAMADLPNRLYELRRAAGLSQQELADQAGCSKMHVSGIERGKREFSLTMMRRFADVLAVSVAELLSRTDNPLLLEANERQFLDTYRFADPEKQAELQRVADAIVPFRHLRQDAA